MPEKPSFVNEAVLTGHGAGLEREGLAGAGAGAGAGWHLAEEAART